MDANKRKLLDQVGYEVRACCGTCRHARVSQGSEWGTCSIHSYDHVKHTGPARALSISIFGGCPQHAISAEATASLGRFAELLAPTDS